MNSPLVFERLRDLGISVAQRASGTLWTDFNLHDPGITLLEQFCYALTELDYRGDFGLSELLADEDGRLQLHALGLSEPREALQFRPVTRVDLTLALAQRCRDVQRVLVYPGGVAGHRDRRGLYDLYVVPTTESKSDSQIALVQVHQSFHAMRNLCEDIGRLELARPLKCRLEAEIEVRRSQSPERTAALIYHICTRMMIAGTLAEEAGSITRRDVFDRPERFFGNDGRIRGGAKSIDLFFQAIQKLDEVDGVTSIAFRSLDDGTNIFAKELEEGEYRVPVVPTQIQDVRLVLRSRGLRVAFDLEGMQKEMMRLRGEDRARQFKLLDKEEWDTWPVGRRRSFAYDRIGAALPAAFGVGDDLPPTGSDPTAQAASLQLRGYLGLSDAPLADINADLALLPELFSARTGARRSYSFVPFDFGASLGLATTPLGSREDLAKDLDPWRDRKGRVLNHLLALYGEAFTQNSLQLHDLTHGAVERQERVLERRARYLDAVSKLAADRAGAPNVSVGEPSMSLGMGRKVSILLGFPETQEEGLAAAIASSDLVIESSLRVSPRVPRSNLRPTDDPLDAYVTRLDAVVEEEFGALLAGTDLLSGNRIEAAVFRRAALVGAYALAREEGFPDEWSLFLDPFEPLPDADRGADSEVDLLASGLIRCGRFTTREEGILRANQLSRCFANLNSASEGLCIIEDVLLRGRSESYAALELAVVVTGWSVRTAIKDFRSLAEETVGLVCPAHILHRVIWLEPEDAKEFDALRFAWQAEHRKAAKYWDVKGSVPPSGPGDELDKCSAALRTFMRKQEAKCLS